MSHMQKKTHPKVFTCPTTCLIYSSSTFLLTFHQINSSIPFALRTSTAFQITHKKCCTLFRAIGIYRGANAQNPSTRSHTVLRSPVRSLFAMFAKYEEVRTRPRMTRQHRAAAAKDTPKRVRERAYEAYACTHCYCCHGDVKESPQHVNAWCARLRWRGALLSRSVRVGSFSVQGRRKQTHVSVVVSLLSGHQYHPFPTRNGIEPRAGAFANTHKPSSVRIVVVVVSVWLLWCVFQMVVVVRMRVCLSVCQFFFSSSLNSFSEFAIRNPGVCEIC